jgi:hypothetical protein
MAIATLCSVQRFLYNYSLMSTERRHERFPSAGFATVRYKLKAEHKIMHAMLCDIAAGGLGLYLDIPLLMDTDVSMDIHFIAADGTLTTDSIEGRALYSIKIGRMYFTGIEFYDKPVSPSKHPLLHAHLLNLAARRFPSK